MSKYRTGNGCRSVIPITSHRFAIRAKSNRRSLDSPHPSDEDLSLGAPVTRDDNRFRGGPGAGVDARTTAGPDSLRKKPARKASSAKDGLAGAKARLNLLILSARLKPCPCYKAPSVGFFRSLWRPAVQMRKKPKAQPIGCARGSKCCPRSPKARDRGHRAI
jgi:hypothetical protein